MSERVIVVVLNRCREQDTAACLRSLERSTYPDLTVLLVDNGSPDGSGDRLHVEFPSVAYLQTGANLGFTGGNNRGIARALAQDVGYVMILNEDTEVEPEAIGRLVAAAELAAEGGARVGGVAPKILYHSTPDRTWYAGGTLSAWRGVGLHCNEGGVDPNPAGGAVETVTFLCGCCWLFPAGVLRAMGGFAEDFFIYAEDVELSVRLTHAGYRLLYQPAARVHHKVSVHPGPPTPFQIHLRDRNRRRVARRAFDAGDRLRFSVWFYPTRIGRLAQYVASGDWARARAIVRGMTER